MKSMFRTRLSGKCLFSRASQIILLLVIVFSSDLALASYGGSGTDQSPYLIYTPGELHSIGATSADWDKHFKLMADIDLAGYTGTQFNIIGTAQTSAFEGVFDGNGHTISSFTYSDSELQYVGLFRYIGTNGVVKNLTLSGVNITGQSSVGGLSGSCSGTITRCRVVGNVDSSYGSAGGITGFLAGLIMNSHATATVRGGASIDGYRIGGLVGSNYYGTIVNSAAVDCIVEGFRQVGGLVGENNGHVSDCYASGIVNVRAAYPHAASEMGGLIGTNGYGVINRCYSTTTVNCTNYGCGGLTGYNSESYLTYHSFWNSDTSGQTSSAGGDPKTTSQMLNINTYTSAGWDFFGDGNGSDDCWSMPSGHYPVIAVQANPQPALPSFSGGNGTRETPYIIKTVTELNSIGNNPRLLDAHFALGADIDLNGTTYHMIGGPLYQFIGGFNGGGHTISNLQSVNAGYLNRDISDRLGLMGTIGLAGVVENLILQVNLTETVNMVYCGGICGTNYGAIIKCATEGSINNILQTGGIAGYHFGQIEDSYSTASVNGYYAGGIAGYAQDAEMDHCYAAGAIIGIGHTGGLVGYDLSSIITDSFWDTQTTGQPTSPGGGVGKLTAEMKTLSTYASAGWDFENVWKMPADDYPKLLATFWAVGNFAGSDDINFSDFAMLAAGFGNTGCAFNNACGGLDMDLSGTVDLGDIAAFAQHWLD
jgi:hypothetical protein